MVTFGKNLKTYRNNLGMNQKDFARMIGLSQSALANYEGDRRFPKGENLKKLSEELNVSIDALMNLKDLSAVMNHHGLPYETSSYRFAKALLEWKENEAINIIRELGKHTLQPFPIYEYVIKTAMYDVGELWSLGRLSILQEHYISQVCHKAVSILSSVGEEVNHIQTKALCMTVRGEEHNLGAKMITDVLNYNGVQTFFIGQCVSDSTLIHALCKYGIDYLAVSVCQEVNVQVLRDLLTKLRKDKRLENLKFIVGGLAFKDDRRLAYESGADYFATSAIDLNKLIEKGELH